MTDLGTLPGDFFSVAFGINDSGQVVGLSCDQSGNCRAFLWHSGLMTDLNALTAPGSSYLLNAQDIISRGEIVGTALDPSNGAPVAVLAAPCKEGEAKKGCSEAAQGIGTEWRNVVLPDNLRKALEQQLGFKRIGAGPHETVAVDIAATKMNVRQ